MLSVEAAFMLILALLFQKCYIDETSVKENTFIWIDKQYSVKGAAGCISTVHQQLSFYVYRHY